jgi:hypothetical protein
VGRRGFSSTQVVEYQKEVKGLGHNFDSRLNASKGLQKVPRFVFCGRE